MNKPYNCRVFSAALAGFVGVHGCFFEESHESGWPEDTVIIDNRGDHTKIIDRIAYDSPADVAVPTKAQPRQSTEPATGSNDGSQCLNKYRSLGLDPADLSGGQGGSCATSACAQVPVSLQYGLKKDFGEQWGVIEVSDNPFFAPSSFSAHAVITNYQTNQQGAAQATMLSLPTGKYYVRSYLSDKAQPQEPGQATSINAISSTIPLVVADPTTVPCQDPLFLYADQEVTDPDRSPGTQAHFRIQIKVAPELISEIPVNRPIKVKLFDVADFDYQPVFSYDVPSQALLISGQEGLTEFQTPELPVGDYFVQVFIDANNSSFRDDTEIGGAYMDEDGDPRLAYLAAKQVKPLVINLSKN